MLIREQEELEEQDQGKY